MPSTRILSTLGILTLTSLLLAQAPPPTAYTITSTVAGQGTMTVYRNGSKAMSELNSAATAGGAPASRSRTLYDLKAMTSVSWDPGTTPAACSAGAFSGDWGDPFAMTAELSAAIAKGDLKPTGSETIDGIATKVYAGAIQGSSLKAWFDEKDGLVIRAVASAPGAPPMTLADVRKVSFTPPPASLFVPPGPARQFPGALRRRTHGPRPARHPPHRPPRSRLLHVLSQPGSQYP